MVPVSLSPAASVTGAVTENPNSSDVKGTAAAKAMVTNTKTSSTAKTERRILDSRVVVGFIHSR